MSRLRFRRLPHVADCRLLAWGRDIEQLIANAVEGTLRHALERPHGGGHPEWTPLPSWPRDSATQLVTAVNEALYLLYSRRRVVVAFQLRGAGAWLASVPLGDREICREIKAATFHSLSARRGRTGLSVTLTLDI